MTLALGRSWGASCPLSVQRSISALDQAVRSVIRKQLREAEGDGARCRPAGKQAVDGHQTLGDVIRLKTGYDADELVTAIADHQVVRAQLVLQGAGDLVQQTVPRGVSALVVDDLELVHVGEHDDERPPVPSTPVEVTLELQEPRPTQVGTRQLVERRRETIGGRVVPVSVRAPAVEDCVAAFVVARHTIDRRGLPVLFGRSSVRHAVRAILPG